MTDGPTDGRTNGPTDGPTKRGVESRSTRLKTNIWYSAVGVILGICDLYFEARGHAITAEDAVALKDSIVSLKPI